MLSTLSHKNIVDYYGIAKDNNTLNIFLEFAAGFIFKFYQKKKKKNQKVAQYHRF